MKILHVPFSFFPDAFGGTEVYVLELAHEQQRLGLEVVVAAPSARQETYVHRGIRVRRYEVSRALSVEDVYGEGEQTALRSFETILSDEKPDLVHFHALTSAVSLAAMRAAKSRGMTVVFTYHTPTVSCISGMLMLPDGEICDGRLDVERCAACKVTHTSSRSVSKVLTLIPEQIRAGVASILPAGRLRTALRMRPLVGERHGVFKEMTDVADRIVALNGWSLKLMTLNGVPASKISVCRHGISGAGHERSLQKDNRSSDLLIGFYGRLAHTKGVDTVIKAVRSRPDLKVQLHIFALVDSGAADAYQASLTALAGDDPRIQWHDAIAHDQIFESMRGLDAVVVPSRWLETGPLVVLEAFAAGVPVLGSRLGGIEELVTDGVNGLLLSHEHPQSWSDALERLHDDRSLLDLFRKSLRAPRSTNDVATEMMLIYESAMGRSVLVSA